jgi:hypothetical protein
VKKKKSRVRQKQPFLKESGLPIQTLGWTDYLPELLLILGLLEDEATGQVVNFFETLQAELKKIAQTGPCKSFTGGVSDLGRCLESDPTVAESVKAHLKSLFIGSNVALLRRFDLPGKDAIVRVVRPNDADPTEDLKKLMHLVERAFDRRGGRATRAKLVQLFLLSPGLKGLHSLTKDKIAAILAAKDDDIPEDETAASVRSSWVALQAKAGNTVSAWAVEFWLQALRQTPCLTTPEREKPDTMQPEAEFASTVEKLDRIWRSVVREEPSHGVLFIGEVILGLMGRIWRMMHHVIDLSRAGSGEMAEIALRCQFDSYVTLRWLLLKNDVTLFKRFREYSAGKNKMLLEYVRRMSPEARPEQAALKRSMEQTLIEEIGEIGVWEQLVAEERGTWADATARSMAQDIGQEDLYMALFSRASDIVHGSWRGLTRYHMSQCRNPLHRYHWIPYLGPTHDAGHTAIVGGIMLAAEALNAVSQTLFELQSEQAKDAATLVSNLQALIASRSPERGFRNDRDSKSAP